MALYQERDQTIQPVLKERATFLWENQIFVIDTFLNTPEKLSLLRFDLESAGAE